MARSEHRSSTEKSGHGSQGLILVVEDSGPRRATLLRSFAECGGVSVLGAAVRECARVVKAAAPVSLVIDTDEHGAIAEPVLEVLRADPRLRVIIPSPSLAPLARRRFTFLAPRLHSVGIPVGRDDLAAVALQRKLSLGQIGPFTPLECLEAAVVGGYSLTLECVDHSAAPLGSLAVGPEKILAARAGGQTGMAALGELLSRSGVYAQVRASVDEEQKQQPDLVGDWRFLVHEAVRQHDERRRAAHPDVRQTEVGVASAANAGDPGAGAASDIANAIVADAGASAAELIDAGVRAVVAKDYVRAVRVLEAALAIAPDDRATRHRLERLYALRQEEGRVRP